MTNFDKSGVAPLVVLDTSELLGFSQLGKLASTGDTLSLSETCRVLTKRGTEVPTLPTTQVK
jgi:hypothetical protein